MNLDAVAAGEAETRPTGLATLEDALADEATPIPTAPARRLGVLRDLVALTKPRITLMVVATAFGGFWLAERARPFRVASEPASLAWLLVGLSLLVGSANTLNMWIERESDKRMARTARRPLPAGRLAPRTALGLGIALFFAAAPIFAWRLPLVAALLALSAFVSYVFVYTPLKPRTIWALPVGAVPGALPPLIGWTAASGRVDLGGLSLFGVLFFWQLPHFHAIALMRREDYARAGLKVAPTVLGEVATKHRIVRGAATLFFVSLLPVALRVGGPGYPLAALVLGGAFFALSLAGLAPDAGRSWARSVFLASIVYLVLLLAAFVAGA